MRSIVFGIILFLTASIATAGALQFGKPTGGLAIAVTVDGAGQATITIKNVSKRPITLLSHVATHETHLDWITLHIGDRVIYLDDDRDKSGRVAKRIQPGETIVHVVDVPGWAKRARNGGKPLAKKTTYELQVVYSVAGEPKVWNGTARSPRVSFKL